MLIYDGRDDKKGIVTNHTVRVVSCNRVECGYNDLITVRKSGREDWSLFYCESGCIYFDDKIVKPGQIWIYPPNLSQKYVIYKADNTMYYYLHFTGSDVFDTLSSLDIEPLKPVKIPGDSILSALENIKNSMSSTSTTSELEAEYNTLYLLTQISKKKKNCSESGMMRRVTENMEHCFAMKYDVKAFAQMLNISESRFNHLFKEYIGVSPYTYFINLRIENAANLLESTDMKIKDVAIRCGFEDTLYFTQAFKRIKGETPSKYRSRIKIS